MKFEEARALLDELKKTLETTRVVIEKVQVPHYDPVPPMWPFHPPVTYITTTEKEPIFFPKLTIDSSAG